MSLDAYNARLSRLTAKNDQRNFSKLQQNNELKNFLEEAITYLKENKQDSELVAHFLMGKTNDLPEGITKTLQLTMAEKNTLYDLLRTHRYNSGILSWFGKPEEAKKQFVSLKYCTKNLFIVYIKKLIN